MKREGRGKGRGRERRGDEGGGGRGKGGGEGGRERGGGRKEGGGEERGGGGGGLPASMHASRSWSMTCALSATIGTRFGFAEPLRIDISPALPPSAATTALPML